MSLRVAPEFIDYVKLVQRRLFPSQEVLAEEVELALSTVHSFLNGKSVLFVNFVEICHKLNLDWRVIAYKEEEPPVDPPPEPPKGQPPIEGLEDIDTLVQKVRQHCHNKIQMLYGKMQLLDISQNVDIDVKVINVNWLGNIQ